MRITLLFVVLLALAGTIGAQTANVLVGGTIDHPVGTCESDYDSGWWAVKNCTAIDGPTLTSLINSRGKEIDSVSHCGDWGPWIYDKNGYIMGRYRNPACPGDGNTNGDTYGIPQHPRTLGGQHLKRNGAKGNWYWVNDRDSSHFPHSNVIPPSEQEIENCLTSGECAVQR